MKQFKIRASAVGQIMSLPKTKKAREAGELSQTAKTFCETWLKEQLYGKVNSFSNKYTEKGIEVEAESIEFLESHLDLGMLLKNDEWKECEFMSGTPDIILSDMIIDVKNSFTFDTFPLFDTELKNKLYYYQLQAYMSLFNKPRASVVYLLSHTPERIVTSLIQSAAYKKGRELTDDEQNEIIALHRYTDVAPELRIKTFEVERDEATIELIKLQVERCRIYIETLKNNIN